MIKPVICPRNKLQNAWNVSSVNAVCPPKTRVAKKMQAMLRSAQRIYPRVYGNFAHAQNKGRSQSA